MAMSEYLTIGELVAELGLTTLQRLQYDPTRTTTLRNAFARVMKRRFNDLEKVIKVAVVDRDAFGLAVETYADVQAPGYRQFDFPRVQQKVEAFMEWLKRQQDLGILEVRHYYQVGGAIEDAWTNLFIYDSYKRGVHRSRAEMRKAGYNVPTVEMSGGIDAIMGTPFHMDTVGVAFTRAFEQLKGITAAMDSQISQILAHALVDGDHPIVVARKLMATINGTGMGDLGITDTLGRFIPAKRRADMLARTEIIRAYHMANVQEMKNYRILGIQVVAEWATAGGGVCEVCASREGRRYSIDEIEGMIPAHPHCRCVALPMEVDEAGKIIEY